MMTTSKMPECRELYSYCQINLPDKGIIYEGNLGSIDGPLWRTSVIRQLKGSLIFTASGKVYKLINPRDNDDQSSTVSHFVTDIDESQRAWPRHMTTPNRQNVMLNRYLDNLPDQPVVSKVTTRAHPPPGVSHELEILFKSKVASYQEKVLQASMAGAELEEVETLYRSVLTPLKEQQNGRDWASPLTKLRSLGSNEENRSPQPFARTPEEGLSAPRATHRPQVLHSDSSTNSTVVEADTEEPFDHPRAKPQRYTPSPEGMDSSSPSLVQRIDHSPVPGTVNTTFTRNDNKREQSLSGFSCGDNRARSPSYASRVSQPRRHTSRSTQSRQERVEDDDTSRFVDEREGSRKRKKSRDRKKDRSIDSKRSKNSHDKHRRNHEHYQRGKESRAALTRPAKMRLDSRSDYSSHPQNHDECSVREQEGVTESLSTASQRSSPLYATLGSDIIPIINSDGTRSQSQTGENHADPLQFRVPAGKRYHKRLESASRPPATGPASTITDDPLSSLNSWGSIRNKKSPKRVTHPKPNTQRIKSDDRPKEVSQSRRIELRKVKDSSHSDTRASLPRQSRQDHNLSKQIAMRTHKGSGTRERKNDPHYTNSDWEDDEAERMADALLLRGIPQNYLYDIDFWRDVAGAVETKHWKACLNRYSRDRHKEKEKRRTARADRRARGDAAPSISPTRRWREPKENKPPARRSKSRESKMTKAHEEKKRARKPHRRHDMERSGTDNDGHGQGRRSRSSGKSQPLTASRESDSPLQLAGKKTLKRREQVEKIVAKNNHGCSPGLFDEVNPTPYKKYHIAPFEVTPMVLLERPPREQEDQPLSHSKIRKERNKLIKSLNTDRWNVVPSMKSKRSPRALHRHGASMNRHYYNNYPDLVTGRLENESTDSERSRNEDYYFDQE